MGSMALTEAESVQTLSIYVPFCSIVHNDADNGECDIINDLKKSLTVCDNLP
jgi:hypothetical protein